jgi:alpha-ketoglutarate-dependent taurine dioxygenase
MSVYQSLRNDPRAWTGASLSESSWRISVPGECIDELTEVVAHNTRHPVPLMLLDPADFSLERCRALAQMARERLDAGPGVVLLERFPTQTWDEAATKAVFWLLGSLIGRPVVQTFDGKIMVEVTDTGVKKAIGVRGFRTNTGQPPHVDNSFNHAPPDYVSLLSLADAHSGGASRFVSFYTVHKRMEEAHPELLQRLYEPFYQDRQGDFWPDEAPTVQYPVFSLDPDLRCRYTHFTIPAGYETAGVPFTGESRAAFETMSAIVQDPELYCEFVIAPGELQIVNNRYCGHGRTEYVDRPDVKRSLLRLWHREWGGRGYSAA